MSTFSIFLVLIIIVSLLLVLAIMIQYPKGGGLSGTFGGSAQNIGGVQKTGDVIEKSTWTLATLLVALILLSGIAINKGGGQADSKGLQGAPEVEQTVPVNTNTPVQTDTPPAETPEN